LGVCFGGAFYYYYYYFLFLGGDLCFVDVGRLLHARLPPLIPSFTRRDFHRRARTGTSLHQDVGGDGHPSVSVSAHLAFDAQPGWQCSARVEVESAARSVGAFSFPCVLSQPCWRLPLFLAIHRGRLRVACRRALLQSAAA
jgi:hypothetical protein